MSWQKLSKADDYSWSVSPCCPAPPWMVFTQASPEKKHGIRVSNSIGLFIHYTHIYTALHKGKIILTNSVACKTSVTRSTITQERKSLYKRWKKLDRNLFLSLIIKPGNNKSTYKQQKLTEYHQTWYEALLETINWKKEFSCISSRTIFIHKTNTCLLNHFKVVHFVHLFYIRVLHLLHELNAQS